MTPQGRGTAALWHLKLQTALGLFAVMFIKVRDSPSSYVFNHSKKKSWSPLQRGPAISYQHLLPASSRIASEAGWVLCFRHCTCLCLPKAFVPIKLSPKHGWNPVLFEEIHLRRAVHGFWASHPRFSPFSLFTRPSPHSWSSQMLTCDSLWIVRKDPTFKGGWGEVILWKECGTNM